MIDFEQTLEIKAVLKSSSLHVKSKPSTKITIYHTYKNSKIENSLFNRTAFAIDEFMNLTFRSDPNILLNFWSWILSLAKQLNLNIKSLDSYWEAYTLFFSRSPQSYMMKDWLNNLWYWAINQSNQVVLDNTLLPIKSYKYFIGKGNNSHVIWWLMKEWFWWISHPKLEVEECNFVWT